MDWNDLRYFLAVARAGNLAGAARDLKVEHTTVSRRLAALERDLDAKLFQRGAHGFSLTSAGERIREHAEAMERAAEAVLRAARDDAKIEGVVRLTTSEAMSGFLVRRFGALRARFPGLVVEVLSGNERFDLSRGEADFAVRSMATADPELKVRKLASMPWGLYAAAGYCALRGRPRSARDLAGHDLIGYEKGMRETPGALWLAEHGAGAQVVMQGNSIMSALNAALAGMGIAAVPDFLAAGESTLERVAAETVGQRDVYLVYHPDRAAIPRVRAVIDFVIEAYAEGMPGPKAPAAGG